MRCFFKTGGSVRAFSISGFISSFIVLFIFTAKPRGSMTSYTLLCLGDSYTIGEMVAPKENFPNQTIQLLRQSGHEFEEAEIIARTGWTTDELQAAINQHTFRNSYDFVTLLIGVNNQYRSRDVESYRPQFEMLVKQSVHFAGGRANHVIVLSIPDWSLTPFAAAMDQKKISQEIDTYNEANKQISAKYQVHYVDITPGTRKVASEKELIAPDGLHPSPKAYAQWSAQISALIQRELQKHSR